MSPSILSQSQNLAKAGLSYSLTHLELLLCNNLKLVSNKEYWISEGQSTGSVKGPLNDPSTWKNRTEVPPQSKSR